MLRLFQPRVPRQQLLRRQLGLLEHPGVPGQIGHPQDGQAVLPLAEEIKRRTVANEACDAGRVLVNGSVAKASVNVKAGDTIEIQFGTKTVRVEVLDIKDTTKKEEASELFRYL